jgi:hypothetical protein
MHGPLLSVLTSLMGSAQVPNAWMPVDITGRPVRPSFEDAAPCVKDAAAPCAKDAAPCVEDVAPIDSTVPLLESNAGLYLTCSRYFFCVRSLVGPFFVR